MPIVKKPLPPKTLPAPLVVHRAPAPPPPAENENTLTALLLAVESIQQNSRVIKSIPELIAAPAQKRSFLLTVTERDRHGSIKCAKLTEE